MKKSTIRKAILFVVVILGVVAIYEVRKPDADISTSTPTPSPSPTISVKPGTSPTPSTVSTVPSTFSLKVPFTAQAPTGNWDELHNEACEEASAIMAAAYLNGDTRANIPAGEVEQQIDSLTKWQQTNFGYNLDTTAAETAQMIRSVYHLNATVTANFTEQDIKSALLANKVVILPVNGRKIGNPYYRQPGPIYHMLVVRGYTKTQLITNDSGTRHGENYLYSFATLKNAPADWNHTTNTIDESKSLMIMVSK